MSSGNGYNAVAASLRGVRTVRVNFDYPDDGLWYEDLPGVGWKEPRQYPECGNRVRLFTEGKFAGHKTPVATFGDGELSGAFAEDPRGRRRYEALAREHGGQAKGQRIWQDPQELVDIENLWQALAANGFVQVKTYIEWVHRHDNAPVYRHTVTWVRKEVLATDPEIAAEAKKLAGLSPEQIAAMNRGRRQIIWQIRSAYRNQHFDRESGQPTDESNIDFSLGRPTLTTGSQGKVKTAQATVANAAFAGDASKTITISARRRLTTADGAVILAPVG